MTDYALIHNGEVVKTLLNHELQEGDLTSPHPVKDVPYLKPLEIQSKVYDELTQIKDGFEYTVEADKVIQLPAIREKTKEELEYIRKKKLSDLTREARDYLIKQLPQYQDKEAQLLALTTPLEIQAFDVTIK